jgi:hypothetical protein
MQKPSHISEEERKLHCLRTGINPSEHCCLDMAWFISGPVEDRHQGPNVVMLYIEIHREYRINMPRNGYRSTIIRFCPWCGQHLPKPLTKLWYDMLNSLGYADPGNDELPEEFNTDRWWKERGL